MNKQNFYDLNFDQLKNFLIEKAEIDDKKAKMRAQQMFNAVYKKNIKNFDELTTFGLELREKIKNLISLDKPKIIDIQKSKDGTIKFLLELKDKRNVETVLIPDKSLSRYTICLSVSVGCYLSCEFCATAQISKKLVRNLTPGEIISQIILCKDYIDDWSTQKKITNQVLMGEGSPFLNLENVKVAIDNSKNKDGLEYGRTRITVSTVGVGIKKDNIDAIEWVELPNTRGMSQFADGGLLATKPYVSSANYLRKMGHYCEQCPYDAKSRHGMLACPFNSLYWDFHDRHRDKLSRNPRIGMVYRTWDKMDSDERDAIRERAVWIKEHLEDL